LLERKREKAERLLAGGGKVGVAGFQKLSNILPHRGLPVPKDFHGEKHNRLGGKAGEGGKSGKAERVERVGEN